MTLKLVEKKDTIFKRRFNDPTESYIVYRTKRYNPTTKEKGRRKKDKEQRDNIIIIQNSG